MKKILIITVLFLVMLFPSVAQGMPVLDVANLMQTIETVYQYSIQVQNTIEQVKAEYQQIENAYQQMKNMDWEGLTNFDGYFEGGEGYNVFNMIADTRNASQQIMGQIDYNMNLVNRVQDELAKESIEFGGMKVSFLDLAGVGDKDKTLQAFLGNAIEETGSACDEIAAAWEGTLTYEERERIMQKYGMSPRNYASYRLAKYEADRILDECIIKASEKGVRQTLDEFATNSAMLLDAMQKAPEGSTYAQLQLTNSGLAAIESGLGTLTSNVVNLIGILANEEKAEEKKEEINASIAERQANRNYGARRTSDFSDDFVWFTTDGTNGWNTDINSEKSGVTGYYEGGIITGGGKYVTY